MEKQYVWKLHSGNELYSGPLAISAMDYEGCYVDPEKEKASIDAAAAASASSSALGGEEEAGAIAELGGGENNNPPSQKSTTTATTHVIPPLHPDDEALINWKGGMGDTSAEQLQQKRDRARAAARLAIAQGYGSLASAAAAAASSSTATTTTPSSSSRGGNKQLGGTSTSTTGKANTPTTTTTTSVMKLKKKHHLHSRILDEQIPHFMKKTTYLTNTATSVHQFTSLAHTQEQRAREVDRALAETSERYKREDMIEMGFVEANSWDVKQGGVVGGDDDDEGGVEKKNGAVAAVGNRNSKKKKKRVHPSKKGVYPVWDLPLLPDVPTWGHTYAHVVLDHPPKSINNAAAATTTTTTTPMKRGGGGGGGGKGGGENLIVSAQQLQKAIVADVSKQTQSSRMACTVWVPDTSSASAVSDRESPKEGGKEEEQQQQQALPPPTKKAKKEEESEAYYQAVQRYDLDVLPLRDPSGPQVHYVWMVDPSKKYVGYHPVGSRVQLSTGRPIDQAAGNGSTSSSRRHGPKKTDDDDDDEVVVVTNESIIYRRGMEVDERKEMEKRMAEVDVDMAEKYGLVVEEDGLEEGVVEKKRKGSGMEEKKASSDSDSDAEL